MLHVVTLTLDSDTIDYMDWCAKQLSEQRGKEVTRSDVVIFWKQRHWIKTMKRAAEDRHDRSVHRKANT